MASDLNICKPIVQSYILYTTVYTEQCTVYIMSTQRPFFPVQQVTQTETAVAPGGPRT